MYLTKILGGFGKTYVPIEVGWGPYVMGILHEKERASIPYLIVSNGAIERIPGTDARYSGVLGRATIPAFPISKGDDETHLKVEALLGDKGSVVKDSRTNDIVWNEEDNINNMLKFLTGKTGEEKDAKLQSIDLLVQTWPEVGNQGMVGFSDQAYQYFLANKVWLAEAVDALQAAITEIVSNARGQPRWRFIGYGLFSKGEHGTLKLEKRPGKHFRFGNSFATMLHTQDPYQRSLLRWQAAYVEILSYMLWRMNHLGGKETLENMVEDDYKAWASMLLMQWAGIGETKQDKIYTAQDIIDQVLSMIGTGVSESFPFMWTSTEHWYEYIKFCIVFGICVARAKAMTLPVEIELKQSKNPLRAPSEFERYLAPPLPNFGSLGQPYLPLATNTPGEGFLFPVSFEMENNDRINIYSRVLQRSAISFTTVEVNHGEIVGQQLDPLAPESYIKWNIHSDVRRWEIEHTFRVLTMWRIPIAGVIDNSQLPKDGDVSATRRSFLVLLNMMTSGRANMKEGFFLEPGFNFLAVNTLARSRTKETEEERIRKEGSNASKPQATQPNTVVQAPTTDGEPNRMKATPAAVKTNESQEMTEAEKSGKREPTPDVLTQPQNQGKSENGESASGKGS